MGHPLVNSVAHWSTMGRPWVHIAGQWIDHGSPVGRSWVLSLPRWYTVLTHAPMGFQYGQLIVYGSPMGRPWISRGFTVLAHSRSP